MTAVAPSAKRVAVVLSGCGFKDGTEITEAVSTLIALSEQGAICKCFAPDMEFQSTSHAPGFETQQEIRNVLNESARISRGEIAALSELHEKDFDALIFPGGFGAALHLSNWASVGAKAKPHADVTKAVRAFHRASKPIGAMCIAPTLIARILGPEAVHVTVGDDPATAAEIQKTGAQHVKCGVTDYISDRDHKIITTPAYMLEASAFDVFTGIRKLVREIVEMA